MAFTYSIVDGFSIVFLLILFFSTRERSNRLSEIRCFRVIVLLTAAELLTDMLAWQLDGLAGEANHQMLWIVNILCYVFSGIMALGWLYYVSMKLKKSNKLSVKSWALISLPCIFLVAVAISTPWTKMLFYINEANTYVRGNLFFIQMVIPFGYLAAAAVWALKCAGAERLRQQRIEYYYLASFIVFPFIGGTLQLAIYGVSLAWPCTALSLMLVYVNMQNQKISLDALTGLNNRGQFDKHLFSCFERADSDIHFALFMLDIDNFKKINDELGHTAGDAALIDAAGVLKRALAGSNAFLARYGGDEFAVILYYTHSNETETMLEKIAEEAEAFNASGTAVYKLVFSAGCARYDRSRFANYHDMIIAADAHMYIQKREHKTVRK